MPVPNLPLNSWYADSVKANKYEHEPCSAPLMMLIVSRSLHTQHARYPWQSWIGRIIPYGIHLYHSNSPCICLARLRATELPPLSPPCPPLSTQTRTAAATTASRGAVKYQPDFDGVGPKCGGKGNIGTIRITTTAAAHVKYSPRFCASPRRRCHHRHRRRVREWEKWCCVGGCPLRIPCA